MTKRTLRTAKKTMLIFEGDVLLKDLDLNFLFNIFGVFSLICVYCKHADF